MAKLEISPEVLDALQKLTSLLESDDALDRTLQAVVDGSVTVLPGCDSAGVTLGLDGDATTAAASDDYTLAIDKIQYETGEGPCLQAIRDAEFQQIEAVSEETRWPAFTERAAQQGFASSLSFPLKNDRTTIGALNLYSKRERAFGETGIALADIFARQAAVALHNAQIFVAGRRLSDQLNEALQTRDLIGQAKGILMEREGIGDEEAFDMLKTISQNTNIKLREVAQRLVEQRALGNG